MEIKSVGPPPEKYADRIVAEMLRTMIETRGQRFEQFRKLFRTGRDGNPEAQAKLAKKLEQAGGPFCLGVHLTPGKRGRYEMHIAGIGGWDPARKGLIHGWDPIEGTKDVIPPKPWLVVHDYVYASKGRGRYDIESRALLFVTHHALSRLTQRCGARTPDDLLTAVHDMALALMHQIIDKGDMPERVAFDGGTAVLVRYDEQKGGVVVVTIVE
jgi:hypothetical protein